MSTTRQILTLHAPIAPWLLDTLLSSIEESLVEAGAKRVWIDPRSTYDLTVLAEFPDSPTVSVPDPRTVDESELSRTYGLD